MCRDENVWPLALLLLLLLLLFFFQRLRQTVLSRASSKNHVEDVAEETEMAVRAELAFGGVELLDGISTSASTARKRQLQKPASDEVEIVGEVAGGGGTPLAKEEGNASVVVVDLAAPNSCADGILRRVRNTCGYGLSAN